MQSKKVISNEFVKWCVFFQSNQQKRYQPSEVHGILYIMQFSSVNLLSLNFLFSFHIKSISGMKLHLRRSWIPLLKQDTAYLWLLQFMMQQNVLRYFSNTVDFIFSKKINQQWIAYNLHWNMIQKMLMIWFKRKSLSKGSKTFFLFKLKHSKIHQI